MLNSVVTCVIILSTYQTAKAQSYGDRAIHILTDKRPEEAMEDVIVALSILNYSASEVEGFARHEGIVVRGQITPSADLMIAIVTTLLIGPSLTVITLKGRYNQISNRNIYYHIEFTEGTAKLGFAKMQEIADHIPHTDTRYSNVQ